MGIRAAATSVACAALLSGTLSACGSSSGDTLTAVCFKASSAVSDMNASIDANKAGTATKADTMKAYKSVAAELNTAAGMADAGALKDLLTTAATDVGKARVDLDGGGSDAADRDAAVSALDQAAPMCKGKG